MRQTVQHTSWGRIGVGLVAVLALTLAACAKKDDSSAGSGGGAPTIKIVSPSDGGSVDMPFTVEVSSNVALGEPSTGDDHVHLCFDGGDCGSGNSYIIGYGTSIQVKTLSAGQHRIEVSLRHADHSDAGPSATVTVNVTGTGAGTGTGGNTGGGYSRNYG